MTDYPMHPEAMLNTERALIARQAVANACCMTALGCLHVADFERWWNMVGDVLDGNRGGRQP